MNSMSVKQIKEIIGPALAVDVVAFTIKEGVFQVLLLKSRDPSAQGKYVLPGAFVALTETPDATAHRALKEKANIDINYLEQLYTFGEIDRDDRGRVVATAYFALVDYQNFNLQTNPKRYSEIDWFPITALPKTAYDHDQMIRSATVRIRNKLQYSNVACHLLPETFSLTQLQVTYEAVLGRALDKRNFRRKVLSLGVIIPISEKEKFASHRPAVLYRFVSKKYQEIEIV